MADHRKHHAHSDEEDDTHTPLRGFLWAHMCWWMKVGEDSEHTPEFYQKWCPDLYKDPVHRWLERYHFVFPLLLFAALYAVGGMSWLVWGGFVRTVFVLHSTWLVNSASHVWGYRSHPTRDQFDELVVGRAPDLRRRLAQQPPRLPDVRSARTAVVGNRYDVSRHPGDEVLPDRLQYPAAQDPVASGCPPRDGDERLIELIARCESRRVAGLSCFPRVRVAKIESALQRAALAQRQSRGLIRKRWRRRVTFDREPGELRET